MQLMELESLSLVDLKNLAKDKGIPDYSKMKKAELIEAIMANYNATKKESVEIIPEIQNEKNNSNFIGNNFNDDFPYRLRKRQKSLQKCKA